MEARSCGKEGGVERGFEGSWWRKVVRRWELWIWRGSSRRMSW